MLTNSLSLIGDSGLFFTLSLCFPPCSSLWVPAVLRVESESSRGCAITVISLVHGSSPSLSLPPCSGLQRTWRLSDAQTWHPFSFPKPCTCVVTASRPRFRSHLFQGTFPGHPVWRETLLVVVLPNIIPDYLHSTEHARRWPCLFVPICVFSLPPCGSCDTERGSRHSPRWGGAGPESSVPRRGSAVLGRRFLNLLYDIYNFCQYIPISITCPSPSKLTYPYGKCNWSFLYLDLNCFWEYFINYFFTILMFLSHTHSEMLFILKCPHVRTWV